MPWVLTRWHASIGLFLGRGRGLQTGLLRNSLPRLEFSVESLALLLELVVGRAQLRNGLLGQELFQRPLFDILLLVLLELGDEANSPLQDRSLVLFASRHDLGQLVDAFVDGLATPTLHCFRVNAKLNPTDAYLARRGESSILPSLWLSLRILCHSSEPTLGLGLGGGGTAYLCCGGGGG